MVFVSIDHPAISCRDVNRQVEWYCRNLGLRLVATNGQTPPGVLLGYEDSVSDGAMIELMPVKDAGPDPDTFARYQPGLRHLALRVDDFDQAYKQLKSAGVKFLFDPIDGATGGGKVVSFRDPEGNELQIVQRTPRRPATAGN
ncbi:MAG: VOC family protein [Tepidisphaeraceae bacterium]|jgi:catechol 2,3-dioxygenase-like lactoylglutathione lyase family enzyme